MFVYYLALKFLIWFIILTDLEVTRNGGLSLKLSWDHLYHLPSWARPHGVIHGLISSVTEINNKIFKEFFLVRKFSKEYQTQEYFSEGSKKR
jgi:hypothetical protein